MTDRHSHILTFAMGLVLSAGAASAQSTTRQATVTQAVELSSVLQSTAATAGASVVQIFTTSYAPGGGLVASSADLVTTQRGSGSGVIVDADGYIVTNAHVVRGASRLRVEIPIASRGGSILSGGSRMVSAEVVGIDQETDLAVLKVAEKNLPALRFGDSEDLRAGQIVLALGSPLGLQNSVSMGVVSAVARQLEPESPMIYVQTDAAINSGSSGGPLVDTTGRLVGINTLIVSQAGGNEGLGFAAPSNIVRNVYEQIKASGRVRRGEIGVRAQTVTPVLAAGLGLPRDYGVILADVNPDGPGARAGLRPGDLVLSLDGKPMENGRQLQVSLYRRTIGELITLQVLRNGQTLSLTVAVTERNDPLRGLSASLDPRDNLVPRLGILGLELDRRVAAMLPRLRTQFGVVVGSTVGGAIDSRDGGLAAGDVIFAVNRMQVAGLNTLRVALDSLKPGDPVVLHVDRQGELIFLAFTLE